MMFLGSIAIVKKNIPTINSPDDQMLEDAGYVKACNG
jgi:hypothetical protein